MDFATNTQKNRHQQRGHRSYPPAFFPAGRQAGATHLLEFGVDVHTVSKLLGHELLATTLIYLHVAQIKPMPRFSPFDKLYQ